MHSNFMVGTEMNGLRRYLSMSMDNDFANVPNRECSLLSFTRHYNQPITSPCEPSPVFRYM